MLAWLANPTSASRPRRQAEVVAVDKESKVYDGIVDLVEGKVITWEKLEGVQPLVSLSHLFIDVGCELRWGCTEIGFAGVTGSREACGE